MFGAIHTCLKYQLTDSPIVEVKEQDFTTHSRFLNLHTKPSIFMLEVNPEQKKFCLLKFWITWKISDQP
jgi:hypothetical protein